MFTRPPTVIGIRITEENLPIKGHSFIGPPEGLVGARTPVEEPGKLVRFRMLPGGSNEALRRLKVATHLVLHPENSPPGIDDISTLGKIPAKTLVVLKRFDVFVFRHMGTSQAPKRLFCPTALGISFQDSVESFSVGLALPKSPGSFSPVVKSFGLELFSLDSCQSALSRSILPPSVLTDSSAKMNHFLVHLTRKALQQFAIVGVSFPKAT
jgi:hypothetical protein